ncbi:MAG: metal ABC transporter permease [Candidatus Methylacidiphilales bacterium]|nr:metal ABC transporter permease [Candidatus Methylacidiphilales bacterium]
MNGLWEPFSHPFMQDALLAGLLVGTVCAVLSCYLVLKGWSLLGDAVSHAVLPGIVLAYLFGLPLAAGAFASGVFCGAASGFLKANSRLKEDTVLGIVFTGLFAFGLVLFSKTESDLHLDHILFGNILGIEPETLRQVLAIGGVTLAVILVLRKDLMLFCFDPLQARTIGLNTVFLHYLLLCLLAATVVVSLQAVGIILVVAMLITPGCIGYLMSDRFEGMMAWSVGSAWLACAAGIWFSFRIDGSTAACIVLAQAGLFIVALLFAPKHGWLAHRMRFPRRNGQLTP